MKKGGEKYAYIYHLNTKIRLLNHAMFKWFWTIFSLGAPDRVHHKHTIPLFGLTENNAYWLQYSVFSPQLPCGFCATFPRSAFPTTLAEMPTSRDLKSGDSLFFTSHLPRKFRTLYRVLHEVDTIQIRDHHFDARNNLCQWLNRCKMPQKPYYSYE